MEINKSAAPKGSLKISEEVVLTVAKQAAFDVAGVAGLSNGELSVKRFLTKANPVSPIKITMSADSAQIDVCVNLLYGYKIKEVAEELQEKVKSTVQNMTGITVSKVNIKVAGIVVGSEETFKGEQL